MLTQDRLAQQGAVLPRWVTTYYEQPLDLVHGEGRHVTDREGRRYLDFFAGILTTSVGYNIPEIKDAVQEQLATGIVHTSTLYFIDAQVRLAERVIGLTAIDDAVAFFCNSGSEANETALLAAVCRSHSPHVVTLADSYHGRTFGTCAVSQLTGWQPSPFTPLLVTAASNGRDGRSVRECLADLERRLDAQDHPPAALLVEPIQGLGGFWRPPPELLRGYQAITADRGAILICDEVQTGWGRTGTHFWGYQAHELQPDLITFAKGAANGFAIGGVVGRREVLDSLPAKSISTFGGNPLATTAALSTIDYLLNHDLQSNAESIGRILHQGLRRLRTDQRRIADVRANGLMIGVDLTAADGVTPDPFAARHVLEACRSRGLLVGLGGAAGATLRIAPPLTVTREEAQEALRILCDAMAILP
ncbi:aminotransferase class III-fold pyridoxal phosphate-dependent enzyme [Actinoplanes sp. NPDC051475]|uniref:aspartate aminotransferase family protein n=1 Tax=Actinoplanes sp. NPDC051475 TaxID=3157225 RepID=UPI00344BF98C